MKNTSNELFCFFVREFFFSNTWSFAALESIRTRSLDLLRQFSRAWLNDSEVLLTIKLPPALKTAKHVSVPYNWFHPGLQGIVSA